MTGRLSSAKDDFWKTFPKGTVGIDLGESQVGERRHLKRAQHLFPAHAPSAKIVQQFSRFRGRHAGKMSRNLGRVTRENGEIPTCFLRVVILYCALFLKESTLMRRPKGIKTRKSVAKRFKISARGKVLRMRAGKRHLLATKNPTRRRSLGTAVVVDPTDAYRITQNLPFSHRS